MGVRTLKVTNKDFDFTDGRLTQLTGIDALVQIVKNRLTLWKGENFCMADSGIDYLNLFNLNKNISIEKRARKIFRDAILADSRVTKLKTLIITFDNSTRKLTVTFSAETTAGLMADTIEV